MYIRVTNRCNMRCEHCIFSCTSKGIDMTYDMFFHAVRLAANYDSHITLGGGEPTLWKYFMEGIDWLFDVDLLGCTSILMVTNGTRYRNTFHFIKLMEQANDYGLNPWDLCVSMKDGFHDDSKIHPAIYEWASRRLDRQRCVSSLVDEGRAKNLSKQYYPRIDDCGCPDPVVEPNGEIRLCGCSNSPVIGNVYSGIESKYEQVLGRCWNDDDTATELKKAEEEVA